jgi:plasmid stabilization system protein ParE
MKRRLVLRRAAQREFDDSISFYNSRQDGLGQEFRASVEHQFERIADAPEQFRKIRGEVRRAVVQRFPFIIHFLMESERIVILAVYHTSRHPERLRYRD